MIDVDIAGVSLGLLRQYRVKNDIRRRASLPGARTTSDDDFGLQDDDFGARKCDVMYLAS